MSVLTNTTQRNTIQLTTWRWSENITHFSAPLRRGESVVASGGSRWCEGSTRAIVSSISRELNALGIIHTVKFEYGGGVWRATFSPEKAVGE